MNNDEKLMGFLHSCPIITENQPFEIPYINYLDHYLFYNFVQEPKNYDINNQNNVENKFASCIEEINSFQLDNQDFVFCQVQFLNDSVFFIFFLKKTIIIINRIYSSEFEHFFDSVSNSSNFYFISDMQDSVFLQNANIQNKIKSTYDDNFILEINDFCKSTRKFRNNDYFSQMIEKVVVGYIIKQAHLNNLQNHHEINSKEFSSNDFEIKNYVPIKSLYNGTNSFLKLFYNANNQKLFVLKTCDDKNNEENCYHELNNHHPFICNYYGKIEYEFRSHLILEYIEGKTLDFIQKLNLTFSEKIKIIGEIMLAIEFIQCNGIIYRDLHYKNVIIDNKHDAYLIDFDNSKINSENNIVQTFNIGNSQFISPEIYEGKNYSLNTDVFSLGVIIHFIINEKLDDKKEFPQQFLFLKDIYNKCIEKSPEKRPNISTIVTEFLLLLQDSLQDGTLTDLSIEKTLKKLIEVRLQTLEIIDKSQFFLKSEVYYYFGGAFFDGKYVNQSINKSLKYFYLSSELNNAKAHFALGNIFYEGKYLPLDINSAIYHYEIADKQNHPKASYNLGSIYHREEYNKFNIELAIYYYTRSADVFNNPNAEYHLGEIFLDGKYVKNDADKALKYFKLSADQNNLKALNMVGIIYLEILHDVDMAIKYITRAADQNHCDAQFNLAKIYNDERYNRQDIKKAIHYFKLSANQNNYEAFGFLGQIYLNRNPRNIDKAIKYYTIAGNLNSDIALFNLGNIYIFEEYGHLNISKAIECYKRSADLGNTLSQYIIGMIYSQKEYYSINIEKAIHYFNLAANKGDANSLSNLGLIYLDKQNVNKAIEYFEKGASYNDKIACFNLGLIYYDKKYKKVDINKAIHYFTLAANQSFSEAQYLLGGIYLSQKDVKKSIYYYELSAKLGNVKSSFNLWIIYSEKEYKVVNIKKAIKYLKMAAERNDMNAQFRLGCLYYEGEYLQKNIKNAIFYLKLSAKQSHSDANFMLGTIYHEGRFVPQNIDDAITFYREGSSFNDNKSKNNLAIIFKNYPKYRRNIYNVIEYLIEGIKMKSCPYSSYNLARIYYFGIGVNKNVIESTKLLKKTSEDGFKPADIFLFYIFSFDESIKNQSESLKYFNKIKRYSGYRFKYASINQVVSYDLAFIKMFDFIVMPFVFIPLDFLSYFYDIKNESNNHLIERPYNCLKQVNKEFYEGFGMQI